MDDKTDALKQKIFADYKIINEFIRSIVDFSKEYDLPYENNSIYIAAYSKKKTLKDLLETLK